MKEQEFLLPPKDQQAQLAELLWAMDEVIENYSKISDNLKKLTKSFMTTLPKSDVAFLYDCGFKIIDGDRGLNYPNSAEFYDEKNGYCLFLNAGNVTKTGFNFNGNQFITQEKDEFLRKGKLVKGDIILTTRGTVGNFAFYTDSVPFQHIRINSGMVILRNIKNQISTELVYKLCKNGYLESEIEKRAYGTAQPQLSVKIISKFKIPILSKKQENKFLSELSKIEESSAVLDSNIMASKSLQKSLINQVF